MSVHKQDTTDDYRKVFYTVMDKSILPHAASILEFSIDTSFWERLGIPLFPVSWLLPREKLNLQLEWEHSMPSGIDLDNLRTKTQHMSYYTSKLKSKVPQPSRNVKIDAYLSANAWQQNLCSVPFKNQLVITFWCYSTWNLFISFSIKTILFHIHYYGMVIIGKKWQLDITALFLWSKTKVK